MEHSALKMLSLLSFLWPPAPQQYLTPKHAFAPGHFETGVRGARVTLPLIRTMAFGCLHASAFFLAFGCWFLLVLGGESLLVGLGYGSQSAARVKANAILALSVMLMGFSLLWVTDRALDRYLPNVTRTDQRRRVHRMSQDISCVYVSDTVQNDWHEMTNIHDKESNLVTSRRISH